MRNRISQFVKFIVSRRLAQILFLVHLILVVYAVQRIPLADPNYWYLGGPCHGIPIADRVFFYCAATGLPKVSGTLDIIGVLLFSVFDTFVFDSFGGGINFHILSWAVALVLLAVTSFQWMLIGYGIEHLLFHVIRNHRDI
jgi:hypothetical protein